MRPSPVVLGVAAGLVGAASQSLAAGPTHQRIVDLLVGWTLVGIGLLAADRAPDRSTGTLVVAAGFAWFAGDLASLTGSTVVAAALTALHRGLLVHALLSYPTGRLESSPARTVTAAVYLAPVILPLGVDRVATAGLLLVVAGLAGAATTSRRGHQREHVAARQAALILAAAPVAQLVARTLLPVGDARRLGEVVYAIAVAAAAVRLVADLLRVREGEVADLVVELAQRRRGALRDALADALGDPTVQIGYVTAAGDGYVDDAGRRLPPGPGAGRVATPITVDDEPVGVVVHASSLRDDPRLLTAFASALRLASRHARLQAQVRDRIADVEASRQRLLSVADEERRSLNARLGEGPQRRLELLRELIETVLREAVTSSGRPTDDVQEIRDQLERALADLTELARGLHPVPLQGGLAAALTDLAGRSPVPVELEIDVPVLPGEVEAVVYYVCAEGLANVTKHASASSAVLSVRGDDVLEIVVADDGVGGADLTGGTGLTGLHERLSAIGSELSVDSPPGGGTRVRASIVVAAGVATW